MGICKYNICIYMAKEKPCRRAQFSMTARDYGVPAEAEVAELTGAPIPRRRIIDGRLPAPPIARTMTLLATGGRRRLRRIRGRAGRAPAQSAGRRAWRLGADADRQRRRLRRALHAARRRRLRHDRDQGQFQPADHARHRPRPRGGTRRRQGAPNHFDGDQGAGRRRQGAGARDLDGDGVPAGRRPRRRRSFLRHPGLAQAVDMALPPPATMAGSSLGSAGAKSGDGESRVDAQVLPGPQTALQGAGRDAPKRPPEGNARKENSCWRRSTGAAKRSPPPPCQAEIWPARRTCTRGRHACRGD